MNLSHHAVLASSGRLLEGEGGGYPVRSHAPIIRSITEPMLRSP